MKCETHDYIQENTISFWKSLGSPVYIDSNDMRPNYLQSGDNTFLEQTKSIHENW